MSKAPDTLDLSTKTLDELLRYKLALTVAYNRCLDLEQVRGVLKDLSEHVTQAAKDIEFEKQNLPY